MILRVLTALVFALAIMAFVPRFRPEVRHAGAPAEGVVTVSYTPGKPANVISPNSAMGAGVDGHEKGDVELIYTPENIKAMRSAGLRPLTYRLRTELGIEAWHWNPRGKWSDSKHKQGYWTSSPNSSKEIDVCYGYRLPRRGSTIDQANNDGYSRIDDGDPNSFWKSNPYLDQHYTGEDNAKQPQWIVIDLGKPQPVDTILIQWGTPYATKYAVEYWQGPDPIYINENAPGDWIAFPNGNVERGKGGDSQIRIAPQAPVTVRYVRVVMFAASGVAPRKSKDVRDGLGYAIREVSMGNLDAQGRFTDLIIHGKSNTTQTVIYASSTDPWHRAKDIDDKIEQPGFDLVFRSGLTNDLPCLVPVAPLYDTPENAVNALRYLTSRGYRFTEVEMGEEPDGQYILPEDYGAFYVQWARAIRKLYPNLKLGGPCFQSTITDVMAWPDAAGNRSWMNRFLKYLDAKGHAKDFQFFSMEWYPFDNTCQDPAPQLAQGPELLAGVLHKLEQDGLSRKIPWMLTEYGYSAFAGQAEVDIPGALLNADIVGQFLTLGGDTAYLYGYEPNTLIRELTECAAWGNLALFLSNDERNIRCPLPVYYASKLYSQEWVKPGRGKHEIYPATCGIENEKGRQLVTAYALKRPKGTWSLMLINKDPKQSHSVKLQIQTESGIASLKTPLEVITYGQEQYEWKPDAQKGRPIRNLPPRTYTLKNQESGITLPPYSITVVRE